MTFDSRRTESGASLWSRLRSARYVLAACALALLTLAISGALAPIPAIVAALVILAAALWGGEAGEAGTGASPPAVSGAEGAQGPLLKHDPVAALIAGLPDPVVVLDGEGVVMAMNAPAAAAAPGLRRGEPALLALRIPALIDAVRRAASTGEAQRAEFSERVPVDRWYEAHVIPLGRAGAAGGSVLILTLHDLTPLRRVEEMRADFVANASHELRTPLAALSGFIDTLRGAAREDAVARERFLAIMQEQAQRMARLIDDLLSLSRIELNAHIRPDQPVDLVAVVRQVIDSLQVLAKEREVALTVTAPESTTVLGDRDELIRVFENLVENALKYGGAGGRAEISIETAQTLPAGAGEARVAIRDYGPGIAPEHLPRLTERFYRVDVGHSRAEGGTGLGLSLVKHILNRHRGRLLIDSAPGEGSTFTAVLPLHSFPR
ncbi:MAG TPA: ATP-binding protein [Xanthobacteraceae bacterium]|nr:ATP-binding protein [Xanthobacteraceae bacterium]